MSFWTAIVIIVAIGAYAKLQRARYLCQHGLHDERGNTPHLMGSPRDAALEREVAQLRERVKVLERIATDDRHSKAIADEIESLRGR